MAPDFPPHAVDETFDLLDPDKSGIIEVKELDAAIRRHGASTPSPQGKAGQALKKVTGITKKKKLTGLALLVHQVAGNATGATDRLEDGPAFCRS